MLSPSIIEFRVLAEFAMHRLVIVASCCFSYITTTSPVFEFFIMSGSVTRELSKLLLLAS